MNREYKNEWISSFFLICSAWYKKKWRINSSDLHSSKKEQQQQNENEEQQYDERERKL